MPLPKKCSIGDSKAKMAITPNFESSSSKNVRRYPCTIKIVKHFARICRNRCVANQVQSVIMFVSSAWHICGEPILFSWILSKASTYFLRNSISTKLPLLGNAKASPLSNAVAALNAHAGNKLQGLRPPLSQ